MAEGGQADIALLLSSRKAVSDLERACRATRLVFLPTALGLVTFMTYALSRPDAQDATLFLYLFGTILVAASLMFWMVDSRYRGELRIAAAVARNAERKLGAKACGTGISIELQEFAAWFDESWRRKDATQASATEVLLNRLAKDPFSLIYLLMSYGGAFAVALISYRGGAMALGMNPLWLLFLLVAPFAVHTVIRQRTRDVARFTAALEPRRERDAVIGESVRRRSKA